jgi:hypothetical protein
LIHLSPPNSKTTWNIELKQQGSVKSTPQGFTNAALPS